MMLFQVYHYQFETDDLKPTTSLVEADNKKEALKKFNKIARTRLDYPYFWNVAKITDVDVYEPEIIR